MMNPHQMQQIRTPSPGRPLNGYQLEDNPYSRPHLPLPMPSSDRLMEQPTVSDYPKQTGVLVALTYIKLP